ncbi:MAG: MBL fold metallo-hydrolase [Lachnospiraceae bacterium]|nr:MBL fold metallo-hydrolase [Lachnospiraceae bacterium]
MTEQITESIYRIMIPLTNSPLKELNSYFIRGSSYDLLVDTGYRTQECREALQAGLEELGSDPARRNVLLTHLHTDHTALATEVTPADRTIWIGETDLEWLKKKFECMGQNVFFQRLLEEGFPPSVKDALVKADDSANAMIPKMTTQFCGVRNGYRFQLEMITLEVIEVPGHTPGNLMLWVPEERIMFTGDHVLFDISPNIITWDGMEDSLGSYLTSLRECRKYDVRLALPGHRNSGNYLQRIGELLAHHGQRLDEIQEIVWKNPGRTAYEITGCMTWRIRARNWEEFPNSQKWFATGECLAHLDHLVCQKRIKKEWSGHLWRYFPHQDDRI